MDDAKSWELEPATASRFVVANHC